LVVGPTIFYRDVLALDIAGVFEALAESEHSAPQILRAIGG
jgi:hypothetical protein